MGRGRQPVLPVTVFNIRGGFGSGKSTIVRELIARHNNPVINIQIEREGRKKPYVEAHYLPGTVTIIGGDYTRPDLKAAGCDDLSKKAGYAAIHGQPGSPGVIERYVEKRGHVLWRAYPPLPQNVLFEGAMVSARWARWAELTYRLQNEHDQQVVWCFLDTPLELQIERVMARSGNYPKWAEYYDERTRACRQKAVNAGFTVREIDHTRATDSFLNIFHELADDWKPSERIRRD